MNRRAFESHRHAYKSTHRSFELDDDATMLFDEMFALFVVSISKFPVSRITQEGIFVLFDALKRIGGNSFASIAGNG